MTTLDVGRKALVSLAVGLALGTATDGFAQQQPEGQKNLEEIVVTGSRIAAPRLHVAEPASSRSTNPRSTRARMSASRPRSTNSAIHFARRHLRRRTARPARRFHRPSAAPGAATINLRGLGGTAASCSSTDVGCSPSTANSRSTSTRSPRRRSTASRSSPAALPRCTARTPSPASSTSYSKRTSKASQSTPSPASARKATARKPRSAAFWAQSFADGRGSVMLGADYSKRDIILGSDRDWVVRRLERPGHHGRRLSAARTCRNTILPAPRSAP